MMWATAQSINAPVSSASQMKNEPHRVRAKEVVAKRLYTISN